MQDEEFRKGFEKEELIFKKELETCKKNNRLYIGELWQKKN